MRKSHTETGNIPLSYYGPLEENSIPHEVEEQKSKSIFLYGKGVVDIHARGSTKAVPDEASESAIPEVSVNLADRHPAHYLFRKMARSGNFGDANYENSLEDESVDGMMKSDTNLSKHRDNTVAFDSNSMPYDETEPFGFK